MPATVVSSQLIPGQGREQITVMDDFGTAFEVYVRVTETPERRQQIVDAAIAQQTTNETALKTYATAHSIDLTDQLAAGAAKRAALAPTQ